MKTTLEQVIPNTDQTAFGVKSVRQKTSTVTGENGKTSGSSSSDGFSNAIDGIQSDIKDGASQAWSNVKDGAQAAWSGIQSLFGN